MHIISIRRGDKDIIPSGDVILRVGDKILFSTYKKENKFLNPLKNI